MSENKTVMSLKDHQVKVDIGCGLNKQRDIGLDIKRLPGVDVVADVSKNLPFKDNTIDEIFCSHTIEHIENPIKLIEEIWRITKPKGKVVIKVPHCQNHGAFRDPTHKSFWHEDTFIHFTETNRLPNWYSPARFKIIYIKVSTTSKLAKLLSKFPAISNKMWNIYSEIEWKLIVIK